MKPVFQIVANSLDITETIKDHLISLRLTDEAGRLSDRIEITLDDRNNEIELPATGAELEIYLGYAGSDLVDMGKYTVDEVELSGPPDKMTIRAQAFDSKKSLKESKTRAWDDITIGNMVTTIAAEHGLAAKVGADFSSTTITHLDQTEESDLNLLTRLSVDYGAISKVCGGYLLFVKTGNAQIPVTEFTPAFIVNWRANLTERDKYKRVNTYYHDTTAGKRKKIAVGEGRPAKSLRHSYPDQATATAAAAAKLASLNRGASTLALTLPGDPTLIAEGKVNLSNFRPGVDGEWLIKRVEHELGSSGYLCRVDCEVPA